LQRAIAESAVTEAFAHRTTNPTEIPMNILRLSLTLLTLAAANVQAVEPAALTSISVRDNVRVVIDCRNEHVPGLRAIGDVLETNNSSRIYAERERLVHTAHRECMRGLASVTFLRDAETTPQSLALAGTR
jgi:hypothetical protein